MGRRASLETIVERIEAGVYHPNPRLRQYLLQHVKEAKNGCWEWTGSRTGNGTPIAYVGRDENGAAVVVPVRRLMMEGAGREPEENVRYATTCRNTGCVNPYHAVKKTVVHTANPDFVKAVRKHAEYRSKIAAIRRTMEANGYTAKQIAEKFGTSPRTVAAVARKFTTR